MKVEWFQAAVMAKVDDALSGDLSKIADKVHADAKATTLFKDKTGKLRGSIKKYKSLYSDGGFVVLADAPHAHLVEYGHGGRAPAGPRPFMRDARNANISTAKTITGAK